MRLRPHHLVLLALLAAPLLSVDAAERAPAASGQAVDAAQEARALLAEADALTAANAVEAAEGVIEAALGLSFDDPVLRVELLNQAAALRLMRSDWLGAYALLHRAETFDGAPLALPPDASLNVLRALIELPLDWEQDLRLQAAAEGGASGAFLRSGKTMVLADVSILRGARAYLRGLPDDRDLPRRMRAVDAGLDGLPPTRESAELLLSFAELIQRIERGSRADQGLNARAASHLRRVDAIGMRLGDDWLRSFANGGLGEILVAEGRGAEARALFQVALLFAQRAGALEASYRWHWRLAELDIAAGELAAAEQGLAIAIEQLDRVREELPYLSSDLFARYVLPVYRRYVDVLLRESATLPEAERPPLLRRARDTLEALKQAEIADYFARQCVVEEDAAFDSDDLGSAAVFYPVLLADRLEILVETRAGLMQRTVPVGREEITAVIRAFRLTIEDFESDEDYFADAAQLHAWLFAPIETLLAAAGVDTVIVVPDGPLRTIPIAALHDGERFLVERFAFVTTPAISLTRRGGGGAASGGDAPSMLVGGLSDGVQGFSPLPGVALEVKLLADRFAPETFVNEQFLAGSMQDVFAASHYDIAHFATHGSFSSDHRQSFILTYDETLSMEDLEGLIGARDGPPLGLLMLSACQTAAGDDRAALGLAGVAVQAGAESAVASLWFISDAATAALVRKFYDALLIDRVDKARALQAAQLQLLLDTPGFEHPSFWAPFLMIGARS
ncbi:MAG TPA: CHAT domain-containing protein [Pseudomonadales bacterium]|nr:CHAT domain-containing protein [Pseudomonadales bacterium]